jgi:photosystem II stability/assembly factor-like uncharacterized protein
MKTTIYFLFLYCLLLSTFASNAQQYTDLIEKSDPTFYEIQSAFNTFWENKTPGKGSGYKQFKRWEWYWESRINDDGTFPSSNVTWTEWHNYINSNPDINHRSQSNGNWQFKGPSTTPGGYNGLGRINCMAFHPSNANTFWVGTPAGGLWKTTNGGQSWTTTTDNLPVLGVTDIAIDRNNPNIMYIATGDGNLGSLSALTGGPFGDTKSIGVLKSSNGGQTWNTTGLNWNVTESKLISRLLINPSNTQILIAATSDGIWRTTNAGQTWTKTQNGYFMDLEFKPTDPNTVYAASYSPHGNTSILRSTNGGSSWTNSINLNNVARANIAVSPASPNLVDILCANPSGGLAGLYYSSDSGSSYSLYFNADCSNNLLHNSYNASGCGGQGWYDLAYAISPTNADDIWLGGINTWNSTNGGSTWFLKTCWNDHPSINPNNAPVVHADKHLIVFHPLNPNIMFECNDGGIYVTTNKGQSWTDLSNGLGISQIYRIGASQTINNNIICGLQDNGTREIYNNTWYEQTGGDGMECIIDYTDANIEYASYANGVIYRTFDFWENQVVISENIPGGQPQGAWVTPFVIDPTTPTTLYAGYNVIYKTLNRGNTWQVISPLLSGNNIRSLAVAPSNSNFIYAASFDTLFFTHNGGTNWFLVSANFPNAKISYIAVHPTNPQTLWLTLSGYNAGNKVYKSIDGGFNWTNISGSLPNLPTNCIVYQKQSQDALYIGTDIGVFYRNATMSDWIPFQAGLPNVPVTELEISYNNRKLWAATFGRGLWNSDLFSGSTSTTTVSNHEDFKIYPNPTNGIFNLDMKDIEPLNIRIFDQNSRLIYSQKLDQTSLSTIDISGEIPGVYYIHVFTKNQQTISKKIILGE